MRKLASFLTAFFTFVLLCTTFTPQIADTNDATTLSILRWFFFIVGSAIAVGLWKWSNHSAGKKQAKMIADAIAASKAN